MYIWRVELENVKCFKHLLWQIGEGWEQGFKNAPGWHVILGDNGAGKSSFIRAIASFFVGPQYAQAFRIDFQSWVAENADTASIKSNIVRDPQVDRLIHTGVDALRELHWIFQIYRATKETVPLLSASIDPKSIEQEVADIFMESLWTIPQGWFCASYGPFRRFTGGNPETEEAIQSNPKVGRHLTGFGEGFALTESITWLKNKRFKELEGDEQARTLLENISKIFNRSDLLPNGGQFGGVSSSGVYFQLTDGTSLPITELSDGYRSILSLTFDLIFQLVLAYGSDIFASNEHGKTIIMVPGVVLIDEVDAHLHPTWQKEIGFWFREHFPNIQFIVTTHSPLVCQAAEKGTIFQLPKPGRDEQGRFITGVERDRLLYGNILDAYSTEVFGSGITRSEASREKSQRLAELNIKEITSGLSDQERQEQENLRAIVSTSGRELSDTTR